MKRILGKNGEGTLCVVSEEAPNKSLSVCGMSGVGKSTFVFSSAIETAKQGGRTLIFNWHNTVNRKMIMPELRNEYEKYVKVIDVEKEGIAIPLFQQLKNSNGSLESEESVVERVCSLCEDSTDLTKPQTMRVYNAVKDIKQKSLFEDEGIAVIFEWLRCQKKTVADNAAAKMRKLCAHNVFRDGNIFDTDAKIIELDLNALSYDTQLQVVKFMLSYLVQLGSKEFFFEDEMNVIVDEAQNLDYEDGTAIRLLLDEGRKLKLNMLIVFPSLYAGKKKDMTVAIRGATRIFFRPLENEMRAAAECLSTEDADSLVFSLSRLKRGEYIASGEFEIGGVYSCKPVKLTTFINSTESKEVSRAAVLNT